MVDSLHTSDLPLKGALIKVVQCDNNKKKSGGNLAPPSCLPPRQRASTLGVITELPPNQDPKKTGSSSTSGKEAPCSARNEANLGSGYSRSRNSSLTSSTLSLNGDILPVVAGHIKTFGDKAVRGDFRIEDRVVVHPSDPSPSTSYLRDTEFRVVSDTSYLVPISSNIPMKLAAMLGGRGLNIYNAALQAKLHICNALDNKEREKNGIKILVVCNDEFSMMAVQLLNEFLVSNNEEFKVLLALAALKDEGLMWYKKNMPNVKLIQWNSDAYDQDLVERTRDACRGDVDIVIGCLGLGAPLQRSFKCLKKGGLVYVTESMNDKVLKSLEKLAEQQGRKLKTVSKGSVDDLKSLMQMVTTGQIQPAFLQEDLNTPLKSNNNPVGMRRKARSLSSRTPNKAQTLQE